MDAKQFIQRTVTAINAIADLPTTPTTGTADSGTVDTLVDNALTQADDYWNHYVLTITGGTNSGYSDIVYDFDAANDRLKILSDFPSAIDNTSTYSLSAAPLAGTPVRTSVQRNTGNVAKVIFVDIETVSGEEYRAIGIGRGKAAEIAVLQVVVIVDDHVSDDSYTAAQRKTNWEDFHNLTCQVKSVLSYKREINNQGYLGKIIRTDYLKGPWSDENDRPRHIARILVSYTSATVVG